MEEDEAIEKGRFVGKKPETLAQRVGRLGGKAPVEKNERYCRRGRFNGQVRTVKLSRESKKANIDCVDDLVDGLAAKDKQIGKVRADAILLRAPLVRPSSAREGFKEFHLFARESDPYEIALGIGLSV